MRRAGPGCDCRGQGARRAGADCDPDGRHERRGRKAAPQRKRDELHDRRFDGRSGEQGRATGGMTVRPQAVDMPGAWSPEPELKMAVLIDKNTRLLVQGLTGREGTFHAKQAAAYHTN